MIRQCLIRHPVAGLGLEHGKLKANIYLLILQAADLLSTGHPPPLGYIRLMHHLQHVPGKHATKQSLADAGVHLCYPQENDRSICHNGTMIATLKLSGAYAHPQPDCRASGHLADESTCWSIQPKAANNC
jgi:hypothetical protein